MSNRLASSGVGVLTTHQMSTTEDTSMSADDDAQTLGSPDEVTKGELVECIRGLEARVEQLEEENDELRQRLENKADQDRAVTRDSVNMLLSALTDADLNDFTADPARHRDAAADFNGRIDSLEAMVKRHESKVKKLGKGKTNGPEESWLAIVEAAKNLKNSNDHSLPENRVSLFAENISQATGKSERMALNYIEDFGEDKEGTTWRPYKPPSSQNGGSAQKKALIVDLNVWGEDQ